MSSDPSSGSRTDRRRFIAAAGMSALALPFARTANAQAKITCRIAHTEAVGSPMTLAFDKYTAILREKSGGRLL